MTVTISDLAGVTPQLRDLMPALDVTAATALAGIVATAAELNSVCDDNTATAAEIVAMCDNGTGTYAARLIACALNTNYNTAITAETGAIGVNGTTVIGHVDALTAATLAAPTAGAKITVCSGSAYAHTVTVTAPVHFKGSGAAGTEVVATFHNTGDESFTAVYESATVWRVIAVNGVTFA